MSLVLLADAHPLIGIAVARVLANEGIELETVSTMADLRLFLGLQSPDLLILELTLPGGGCISAIEECLTNRPSLPILVLTQYTEQELAAKAIQAGANGYLSKTCEPEVLIEAVRLVIKGERYISTTLGIALAEFLSHSADNKPIHHQLSARELGVLLKISEGYTTVEIAAELQLSSHTVGTYRARVREKTGLMTTAEMTRYVVERGLDRV